MARPGEDSIGPIDNGLVGITKCPTGSEGGRIQPQPARPPTRKSMRPARPTTVGCCRVAGTLGVSAPLGPRESNAPSIANRTSPMAWTRCLGSFSKQRCSTFRSFGGVVSGRDSREGSRSSTFASVSDTSSPTKARSPVSISNSTTPNAQMSERRSVVFPRACSGDIYAAVPMITPICVSHGG